MPLEELRKLRKDCLLDMLANFAKPLKGVAYVTSHLDLSTSPLQILVRNQRILSAERIHIEPKPRY